jgi:nitrogen fixation/metabolism regulation signal transduction histidine kinase
LVLIAWLPEVFISITHSLFIDHGLDLLCAIKTRSILLQGMFFFAMVLKTWDSDKFEASTPIRQLERLLGRRAAPGVLQARTVKFDYSIDL